MNFFATRYSPPRSFVRINKSMKKFTIKPADKKKVVMDEPRDYQILEKIYQLEKRKLTRGQKELVVFLKTQLEDDWRAPLLEYLDKLLKRI